MYRMANGNIQKKYKNKEQHGDVCITSCCNICSAHLNKYEELPERNLPYNNKRQTSHSGRVKEFMFHGIERPRVLIGLSMVEKAVISQVQVVNTSKVLKYGQLSFSGHTLFACRNLDMYKLQKTLPLLPDEVSVIVIKPKIRIQGNSIAFAANPACPSS